ncbi:MAG: hypothetical protein JSV88_16710 [Candidatus Aminicenantes bacterium]|nr:MAG: hypothetical protein JSV88_16710 [Candidatus Aminicenantes bacterium]
MNSKKFIVVLALVFLLSLPITGEKRRDKKSMKELTDPSSPSYVPYPYPKNRKEIIADLKYYVEKYCDMENVIYVGTPPITDIMLNKLFEPQSSYRIWKIIKVKNRIAQLADNYTWLILVMDRDGNIPLRVALKASGLWVESGAIGENDLKTSSPGQRMKLKRLMKSKTDEDVKNVLSESLGRFIDNKEIKKMERVAYSSPLGCYLFPVRKTKMVDGTIYYYSEIQDVIYSIDKKIPWKKDKQGFRPYTLSLVPHRDYLPDTIDDELVVLKKIPRK